MLDAKEETGGQKIDSDDIQAQSFSFLLAGYETSSTTLGFVCYHLALNTHVQDKLKDEIDRMWPGDVVGGILIDSFVVSPFFVSRVRLYVTSLEAKTKTTYEYNKSCHI